MLESMGCVCGVAHNGAEALSMLKAGLSFDMIWMDQQMPIMDGPTAVRAIRALGIQTPIVALTASAFAEDPRTCLSAGMNDFLTKPISRELLQQTLATWAVTAH